MTLPSQDDELRFLISWGGFEGHLWFRFAPRVTPIDTMELRALCIDVFGSPEFDEILANLDFAWKYSESFDGDFLGFLDLGFDMGYDEGTLLEVSGLRMEYRYEHLSDSDYRRFLWQYGLHNGKLRYTEFSKASPPFLVSTSASATQETIAVLKNIFFNSNHVVPVYIRDEAEQLISLYTNSLGEA